MGTDKAQMVFTDPPYNVPINGHVCGNGSVKHEEFAMAVGEMSETEFTSFLTTSMSLFRKYSISGAIAFCCMDWRHMEEILRAGKQSGYTLKNLCVWVKDIQVNQEQAIKYSGVLTPEHIEFLDMDAIYFDLQAFKNERAWFNLNISKAQIKSIFLDASWYEILIPKEQLLFDGFDKVHVWQNIASNLIQKYCDRFYKASKDQWEAPHREYRDLDPTDPSFIAEYKVLIDKSQQQIINQLKAIKAKIESGEMPTADLTFGQGRALVFVRKWDGGMSEDDFAAKHILFQASNGYIKRVSVALSGAMNISTAIL
jgi:hypothetical protein